MINFDNFPKIDNRICLYSVSVIVYEWTSGLKTVLNFVLKPLYTGIICFAWDFCPFHIVNCNFFRISPYTIEYKEYITLSII